MSPNVTKTAMHRRSRNPGTIDSNICEAGPLTMNNLWGWWPLSKQTGYNDADLMNNLVDYSGNNHSGISNGTARPTYKTNIVNGYPVARFAGTHWFDFGGYYSFNLATYFIVWSRTNAANSDAVFLVDGATYSYLQYGSNWHYKNGGPIVVAMAAGSFKLKCAKYDNANVTLYTNGAQDSSPASNTDCYWRYMGCPGFSLNGDIAEVIVFNTNLSDADRQYVENYINAKYALW